LRKPKKVCAVENGPILREFMAGRLGIYYLRTHTLSRELFLSFSNVIDLFQDSKTLNPQGRIFKGLRKQFNDQRELFDIQRKLLVRSANIGDNAHTF
jgi:hypothetical protein